MCANRPKSIIFIFQIFFDAFAIEIVKTILYLNCNGRGGHENQFWLPHWIRKNKVFNLTAQKSDILEKVATHKIVGFVFSIYSLITI